MRIFNEIHHSKSMRESHRNNRSSMNKEKSPSKDMKNLGFQWINVLKIYHILVMIINNKNNKNLKNKRVSFKIIKEIHILLII